MTDRELERLADLVAERLRPMLTDAPPRHVDAATLADMLGICRTTVYANADLLGAERQGDGPRPRLSFDPVRARERFTSRRSAPPPPPAARRRPPQRPLSGVPLLPIAGRDDERP